SDTVARDLPVLRLPDYLPGGREVSRQSTVDRNDGERLCRLIVLWSALAQEPLEVSRDGVGRGDVLGIGADVLDLVHRLLALLYERLHLGVAVDRRVDLALVVLGRFLEGAPVDGDSRESLEAADERQRRLRVGRRRHVVRHGGPQAGRWQAGPLAG